MKFHVNSWESENFHFDAFLLSKWYKVSAKKSTEVLSLIKLKIDETFKEKLNVVSNMTWGVGKFSLNHSKFWKFYFDGFFLSKLYMVWAKKIHMSYLSWRWTMMLKLSKLCPWHEELGEVSLEHSKVRKIVLWQTLLSKSYNVLAKKLQCVMTLKSDAKFKGKLIRGLKIDIRSLVNLHKSSRKSENLHFDGFLLSKAYNILDEKVQKSYVSWHWKVWRVWCSLM